MSKVLLIVDMQNGFMQKSVYSNLIPRINNLIKKSKHEVYIFTKFINNDDSMVHKKLNWENLMSKQSQQICIYTPPNSIIFEKSTYGISSSQIEKIKSLLNKDDLSIDICGLQADAFVYAISLQLFDNGIFPNVLINYTATENDFSAVSKIFNHQFGKIDNRE